MLHWVSRYSTFCYLDNHSYNFPPHSTDCLAGAGLKHGFELREGSSLNELNNFITTHQKAGNWLMGHLNYDLKNFFEPLYSKNPGIIGFPEAFMFVPEVVIQLQKDQLHIYAENPDDIFTQLHDVIVAKDRAETVTGFSIHPCCSREDYIDSIKKIQQHIVAGDCYELNYCMNFQVDNYTGSPLTLYRKLSSISPNPFAALYRYNDLWAVCASPERFLKKEGNTIISQPIKGTLKRNLPFADDVAEMNDLRQSAKDRAENVMIVDLMRNDLSKLCEKGSVYVDELFGVYSFPQLHQMISTIKGTLRPGLSFVDILKATFPMGSMTGAPKYRVMQLIEKYEHFKRELFAGSVGYIDPQGDFDFNVVIRSLFYNAGTQKLAYMAGSGITHYSNPEQEWEECLLKVSAMEKVLNGKNA